MITIAMKSKGCVDRSARLSINHSRRQDALSAGSINTLNRPAMQPQPRPRTQPTGSAVPPVRTTPSAAVPPARKAPPASAVPPARTTPPASIPAAPARRKLPAFQKPVQKGQKLPLSADGTIFGTLKACFGWNTSHPECDADVSAFLLGADGKVLGDSWFLFYGQTESPDKSCHLQTQSGTDREVICIDFQKLHKNVKKIVFVLTINEAFTKRLHFGMMQDAYVRILNDRNMECVSFRMSEYYSNVISMMIGEIYEYNGSWKFHAVGNGVAKDLAGLCALYGVEVSD